MSPTALPSSPLIGELVRFRVNESDEPAPAIVMRLWPGGEIELYVFHFEAVTHIRAAHPSQVERVNGETVDQVFSLTETYIGLEQRVTDLEIALDKLTHRHQERIPEPSSHPDAEAAHVESTPEEPEQEAVPMATKRGRGRGAWPNA